MKAPKEMLLKELQEGDNVIKRVELLEHSGTSRQMQSLMR